MTVGDRIRLKRQELNMTQLDLAKKMGYTSKTAISRVETNKEDITTVRVRKFADALNVTPSYLMGWEEEEQKALAVSEMLENEDNGFYALVINIIKQYKTSSNENKQKMCNLLSAYYDLFKWLVNNA